MIAIKVPRARIWPESRRVGLFGKLGYELKKMGRFGGGTDSSCDEVFLCARSA